MANTVNDNPDLEAEQNPESNATLETNDSELKYDVMASGDEYADPANEKWPLDADHIKPALSYYNGAKDRDGNSVSKWKTIGNKIAAFATKHYGKKYTLQEGKVVAAVDGIPLNVCPKCKNSGCTGSYCPHCGQSLMAKGDANLENLAINPVNSTNATPGDCPSCLALNQIEKFCTVCGQLTNYIPDSTATVSVITPYNTSTDPAYLAIDSVNENEEIEIIEEYTPSADEWTFATDAKTKKPGVLGRVRQLAMVVNAVNRNNRLYPSEVAGPALDETSKRVKMGIVHSEYRHPAVVSDGGKQAFVDNHDRKTSTYVNVEKPNAQGQVFVTRDILDTPHGREVYQDFLDGKPRGLSTRMLMKAHKAVLDGKSILVAKEMKIPTWDDMGVGDSPAVPDTQKYYQLLTDAELSTLGLEPTVDSNNTAANAVSDKNKEKEKTMNEDIQAALDAYTELALEENPGEAVVDNARKAVISEIKRAKSKKEITSAQVVELMKALADADGLFGNGREQPVIVDAKQIASPTYKGLAYAEDIKLSATPTAPDQIPNEPIQVLDNPAEVKAEMDADSKALLNELLAERNAKKLRNEIEAAVDAKAETAFADTLPENVKARIISTVKKTAKDVASIDSLIEALIDNYGEGAAEAKLNAMGHGASPKSFTHVDPYSGGSTVVTSVEVKPSYMAGVDEILAAVDKIEAKDVSAEYVKNREERKAIREYNRKNFIYPLLQQMEHARKVVNNEEAFLSLMDSITQIDSGPFQAMLAGKDIAATDATVLSNIYNQPTVSNAILVQTYQDLTALQYVDPIGPKAGEGDPNWTSIPTSQGLPGWILRIPSETWTEPSGVGTVALRSSWGSFDAGLLVADNAGIPEGTINEAWQAFTTVPRSIAFSVTRGSSRSAGLGPLNLDIIARSMYHTTYRKNRTIDKALYDDMLQASDTYNSVSVASETVNNTYNSVYNAAGYVIVNLNPKKAASATPAVATSTTSADPYITYGANVIAAVRTAGPATPGSSGATIYSGTSYGVSPIVKSKYTADLSSAGAYNPTYTYPVTVSSPSSSVEGYLDSNKQVQNFPGNWFNSSPGTATFAVDHEVGVICFNSVAPPSGTGSLITSTVTVSYYYATNFINLIAVAGGPLDTFALLGNNDLYQIYGSNTVLVEQYLNTTLREIDQAATAMTAANGYMSPNLLLGSVQTSNTILPASLFYKLNSPTGTVLFPEDQPSAYFERNGILGCRHNSPWQVGDHRLLLTKKGTTKYGVGQPAQFFGPYPKYDASNNLIATDAYYMEEYSTIATPYVKDANGNLYNVPSRTIVFRSPNG